MKKHKEIGDIVSFLEKNHYPMTIHMKTIVVLDENKEEYQTTVKNDIDENIAIFKHKDLHTRMDWANGFFTALWLQKEKKRFIWF